MVNGSLSQTTQTTSSSHWPKTEPYCRLLLTLIYSSHIVYMSHLQDRSLFARPAPIL
ncbi:hypothetical protein DPMN_094399 [Dreissena polymorpha]|uniref:Uncharacterized protein n=1 Tax=Dreissena polymorpha TaxID=45954 RepID=A0A9D4R2U3_DREPO|nr:hypothetical protein DPMN_094399 [Dreissena polymorpha]